SDSGGTGAEEQEGLLGELPAGGAKRSKNSRKRDRRGALDVIVEAANPVAVAGKQPDGVGSRPILELDAAIWELFLDRSYEFFDKLIQLRDWRARLAQAQIERVAQQGLIVSATVDEDGERVLRRHASACGIERQLADRDSHAVCAEIAKPQNSLPAADHDEAHVALRPIAENFADAALAFDRQVKALGAAHDVAKLQAGLAHRRGVNERQELHRVRHEHAEEERFVGILQLRQVDVLFQIVGLLR